MLTDMVRLASIGVGWWGGVLAEKATATGVAEIVACFARNVEKREAFAVAHGCRPAGSYDEVLADPSVEGVLIATSHESHRPLIEQAASAGKAIFVEKPLTTTVEDAEACVAAADAGGVILQVGHQRRRLAAEREIRRMLDAGEMGEIEMMEGSQSIPNGYSMPDEAWRWSESQSPLGSMTSLGIHKLDSFLYLAGPVRSVFAFSRKGRHRPIDEATALAFEFVSGAVGTLVTSFFTPRLVALTVSATDTTAIATEDGARLSLVRRTDPQPVEVPLIKVDPLADQLVEFARAIRGETRVEVDGRAGLEVVRVLAAAVESAATRRAVDVTRCRTSSDVTR